MSWAGTGIGAVFIGLYPQDTCGVRWRARVEQLGPRTGPYPQYRILFQYNWWSNWHYSVIASGLTAPPGPPPWNPGDYGVFWPGLQDAWASGFSALAQNFDDVYHYVGIKLLADPELPPGRQAHRFADTDSVGYVGTATGAGPTGNTLSLADTNHNFAGGAGAHGYHIILHPGNPSLEESRKVDLPTQDISGQNPVYSCTWLTPLQKSVIGFGTPYKVVSQREEVVNRTPYTEPMTIDYKMERTGIVTDPPGNLYRDIWDGAWVPLLGDYEVWVLSNAFEGGAWRDVCEFYFPYPYFRDTTLGHTRAMGFGSEHHYITPENPLASNPFDLRWSNCEIRETATGKWHLLLKWQISSHGGDGSDTDYGFNPTVEAGKIVHRVGFGAGEFTIGRWQQMGLTYRHTGAALTSNGNFYLPETAGSDPNIVTYHGPRWTAPGGLPFVMHEADYGYHLMHPTVNDPALAVFVVPRDGLWTLTGGFAKGNPAQGWTDGVRVRVIHEGEVLFNETIEPGLSYGTQANPFQGDSHRPFSLTRTLAAGQEVLFQVSTEGSDPGGNLTAFDFASAQYTPLDLTPPEPPPSPAGPVEWYPRRQRRPSRRRHPVRGLVSGVSPRRR